MCLDPLPSSLFLSFFSLCSSFVSLVDLVYSFPFLFVVRMKKGGHNIYKLEDLSAHVNVVDQEKADAAEKRERGQEAIFTKLFFIFIASSMIHVSSYIAP